MNVGTCYHRVVMDKQTDGKRMKKCRTGNGLHSSTISVWNYILNFESNSP